MFFRVGYDREGKTCGMATGQEEGFVSCFEGLLSTGFGLVSFSFLGMFAFAHCMCIVLCLNFSVCQLLVWVLHWQSAVSTACCFLFYF